ncbi:hypothetical protein [Acinetobacter variabilis]|uniref:hypothetical protein n=1 Tax=Acinetobacter variabilis TaxID=70346 RepID=UPI002FDAC1DE
MILDREIQLIMMRKMQIVYPSYYDFDIDYPTGHQDREKALKNSTAVHERRMLLNAEDPQKEEDLISDFAKKFY